MVLLVGSLLLVAVGQAEPSTYCSYPIVSTRKNKHRRAEPKLIHPNPKQHCVYDIWDILSSEIEYHTTRGERIIRYSNIIRIIFKYQNIRIRIRSIFSNRIIFVFVFG